MDTGTTSLFLAVLLLLLGLWADIPLERLAGQSAVLGAVFFLSLFRTPSTHSHSIQPRLPAVRSLVNGAWTLVDADALDPGDSIEVHTGDIIPTACEVLSSKGDFQASPSLCAFSVVKSGSAVLKVVKAVEDREVAETWRLPAKFQAIASALLKLAVVFQVLQGLQMTWKWETTPRAAETVAMLWLVWETAKEGQGLLYRSFDKVKVPLSVSFWRRWQAGDLSSLSSIHLSFQDEFLSTVPVVASVLRPGPRDLSIYPVASSGLHPQGEIEGLVFDRWWFLLATHCAVSSQAGLVSWKGRFVAYGSAIDTAMRVLVECIGACDPGFHRVTETLCPEQYSQHVCRSGTVEQRKSDEMGQWTLRKSNEGYQTLLRGDKTALTLCSQFYFEGKVRPLEEEIRVKFEEFDGVVLCAKTHTSPEMQNSELTLIAGLIIKSQVKPSLTALLTLLPDITFVVSTASTAEIAQLTDAFPYCSLAEREPSRLVLVQDTQAAKYLASLHGKVISTSLAGGLTLAGERSSVSRSIQADVVLKGESLSGLADLIRECRRAVGLGTVKALFLMQCVVAVLLYGLGKQALGRGEHLDMPWAALALVFCCLLPANLADKYITQGSATLTRASTILTCLWGAAAAILALCIENQCFLQPEWLLDTRSPDFLQQSRGFSQQVQATGLKSLHLSLQLHSLWLSPSLPSLIGASGAFITCALTLSWKSGLGFASEAEVWTIAGTGSLLAIEALVHYLRRPRS